MGSLQTHPNLRRSWRSEWKTGLVLNQHNNTNNGHAGLASERYAAHKRISNFIRRNAMEPFEVSFSNRSTKFGHTSGYHAWFDERDRDWAERNDPLRSDHVAVLVDVDYYMREDTFAMMACPMAMLTFYPETPTGSNEECSWNISSGSASFTTVGGRTYEHKLWNWTSSDYVYAMSSARGGVVYTVDTYRVSTTHVVVLVNPTREFTTSEDGIPTCPRLERHGPLDGITVSGDDVVLTHGPLSIRLPASLHQQIHLRSTASKSQLGYGSIVQMLVSHGLSATDASAAAAFYAGTGYATNVPDARTLRTYTAFAVTSAGVPIINEDKQQTHVDVGDGPCVAQAFIPAKTKGNAAAAVVTRIHEVAKPVDESYPIDERMDEFISVVSEMTGVTRCGVAPLTMKELADSTSKASTAARINEVDSDAVYTGGLGLSVEVGAFVKDEAYAEVKDPRNISATDSSHLAHLASYTVAVKMLVLSNLFWYFPKRNPIEVARDLCGFIRASVLSVFETDFSRFDGTISARLRRAIEVKFYRFFCGQAAADLIEKEISGASCRTGGMKYDHLGTRLSGSPLTTDGNTLINAVVQFCAGRDNGLSPREAFAAIGPCYGDDGVTRHRNIVEVARKMGLTVKAVERCTDAVPHVGFLGRCYPAPREHDGSFQEPNRVFPRLSIVAKHPKLSSEDLFLAKCSSFALTDSNAPLLGPYCQAIMRLRGSPSDAAKAQTRSYLTDILGITSVSNSWPQIPHRGDGEVRDLYAKLLGVTRDELDTAEARVASATHARHLKHVISLNYPEATEVTRYYVEGECFVDFKPVCMRTNSCPGPISNEKSEHPRTPDEYKPQRPRRKSRRTDSPPQAQTAPARRQAGQRP